MLPIYLEVGQRRVFAAAIDWPGWARCGPTEQAAIESLLEHGDRYAEALGAVGIELPSWEVVEVVDTLEGNATTDFGAPGAIPDFDRRLLSSEDLEFHITVLGAGWRALDRASSAAAAPLMKGPRGGGRELDAIVVHVVDAERSYAPKIGVRGSKLDPTDVSAVGAFRQALVDRLRSLPGDTTWPLRAFVRRTAWHALDHAWEIENRSV